MVDAHSTGVEPRGGWITRPPRSPAIFAALITATAGYLDAVGYVQLAGLYISFMSGNSTHLGVSVASAAWADAASTAAVILAFVVGAFLGAIVAERAGAGQVIAVLLAELLVLLIALGLAIAAGPRPAMHIVAAAMGMQNSAHQRIAGADVGKSYVTGTLFSFGRSLAQLLAGKGGVRPALVLAGSWLALVGGVMAGATALATFGLLLSLVLIVLVLALAVVLVVAGWL